MDTRDIQLWVKIWDAVLKDVVAAFAILIVRGYTRGFKGKVFVD